LTVTIDKSAGFCWGVIRTIDIAEAELEGNPPGESLYVLGDIIHNPMETERLRKRGLKTISHADLPNIRDGKVLIRAHGEPPSTFARAREAGVTLVDATCPVVWKVQERIKKFHDQGYQVVIYGKKDHAEVIGLVGHTNGEAIVIKSMEEIALVDLNRKTVLFSQTTMDKATFYQLKEEFQKRIKELVIDSFDEEAAEFTRKIPSADRSSGATKSSANLRRVTMWSCSLRAGTVQTERSSTISARMQTLEPISLRWNRSCGPSGLPE